MKIPKTTVAAVAVGILCIALAGYMGISLYSRSAAAKSSLIVQYYRAVSSDDSQAISALTGKSFSDQLGIIDLKPGSYELYDMGESGEGILRYIIILTGRKGGERAILADMAYSSHGLSKVVEAVRPVDQGKRLKE
jgi:hypothetical protein